MKADIKKYVRTNEGEITTLGEYYIKNKIPEDEYYFEVEYLLEFEPIIKIVNTPAELVQADDIIEFYYIKIDGNKTKLMKDFINEWGLEAVHSGVCYGGVKIVVTKILTPNSSGGYGLQYSKEEK